MEKFKMNTSELIPYECVSPIIINSEKYPNVPYYSGTGFFVQFKPYEYIFFITAHHCTHNSDNEETGLLKIPVRQENCTKQISFSYCLTGKDQKSEYFEDVAVYVVDHNNEEQMMFLKKRALRLIHQDDVDCILDFLLDKKAKLRTVGFPSVDEKMIDYNAWISTTQIRGFNGNLTSKEGLIYTIEHTNWKDNFGKFDGFSGSPVIEFLPANPFHTPLPPKREDVEPVALGIIVMGSNNIVRFLSINIATNLIAGFIKEQLNIEVPRYGLNDNA